MQVPNKRSLSVSVIIPTYNRAAFVVEAVKSALNQTRPPEEIVVVDDGSTDDTLDVLRQFGPSVTVVRQPNRGVSAARNRGLRAATRDAVLFLDSDDVLMPHCIELEADVLEHRPDVDVVYSDVSIADRALTPIESYSRLNPGPRPSGMILGELGSRTFVHITSLVRRSSLGETLFDETMRYGEDWDLWRRLATRCRFHYIDEPLIRYRHHDAMATKKQIEALDGEIEVQRRFIAMDEFETLPRRAQSAVLCSHGAKLAMRGKGAAARRMFWRAVRTAPTHVVGHVLLVVSFFGVGAVRTAILKRRRMIGHRLDFDSEPRQVPGANAEPLPCGNNDPVAAAAIACAESSPG